MHARWLQGCKLNGCIMDQAHTSNVLSPVGGIELTHLDRFVVVKLELLTDIIGPS